MARVGNSQGSPAANQGIERAASILRVLGRSHETGARLTDVAEETGLSKSTIHRLLGGLVHVGFVEQDSVNGRFYLSFEMFSLGSAAANRNGIVELAHACMQRLCNKTGDTVTLHIRSGADSVCANRLEGAFPVKIMTLAPGDRRPLGVMSSGPLALLSFLPDAEVEAIINGNAGRLAAYSSHSQQKLYECVELTRRSGYAFGDGGVVPEISGVAVPIKGKDSKPMAAISVATLSSRMQEERRTSIVQWLSAEVGDLEKRILSITAGLNEPAVRRLNAAWHRSQTERSLQD